MSKILAALVVSAVMLSGCNAMRSLGMGITKAGMDLTGSATKDEIKGDVRSAADDMGRATKDALHAGKDMAEAGALSR